MNLSRSCVCAWCHDQPTTSGFTQKLGLSVPVPSSHPLESGQNKGNFSSLGMSVQSNVLIILCHKTDQGIEKAFANSWSLLGFSGMLSLHGFSPAGASAAPACPNPTYSLRPWQTPFPRVNVNLFFLWASSACWFSLCMALTFTGLENPGRQGPCFFIFVALAVLGEVPHIST